ncbi:hypothetical protein E3Q22_00915 [Wallemia mellicola]|uniref:C2H2-type domain-containing protein n=2 Tax=Wallemia mellicola TaxID=1708541 RepID=A0A4T0MEJ0_9BASI|nr:hypothetical protein WALSEDRAFT_29215 [Wallemia mellicola CBS 633.66]TIB73997.1 hypothetical protein E3Q24_00857 [Wallemia mellicola]EIM21012.1 hypothetical protein WALSEDRAFT_29215 [Wallemia mellicola CBS 633.66]TIB78028.1 hypothetical protein E3Q23_00968 [Wallemia mellicola]TIB81591.1 hypothetical protein E3Q22_00915 [Wallemia mellicola]TIB90974.1 hypothetical protein E3Q21_00089 [Wallemia mellicola]|eukprot:XP_006958998.1 hypothetical protein WALSEDRAFT_29215 [Wallemia mellicola CBS 633.66]
MEDQLQYLDQLGQFNVPGSRCHSCSKVFLVDSDLRNHLATSDECSKEIPLSEIDYLRAASNDIASSNNLINWYGEDLKRYPEDKKPVNTFSVHTSPSHHLLNEVTDLNGSEEDAAYDEDGAGDDSMSALPPAMRPTAAPMFQDQTLGFRKIESPDSHMKGESLMARRANYPAYDETKYNTAEEAMAHALSQVPDQSDPRPFKCPNPECSKTWKNRNGLKYHINHGNCNGVLKTLSRDEAAVSERPYACPVPGCNKRWKNANGFRYHMDHSGAHGRSARRLHEASGGFAGKSNLQSITSPQTTTKTPKGTRRSSRRSSRRIQYDEDEEDGDAELEEEDDYGDEEDDDDDDDDVEEEDDAYGDVDDAAALHPTGGSTSALPAAATDQLQFSVQGSQFPTGPNGKSFEINDGRSFEVNPVNSVDPIDPINPVDSAQPPVIGQTEPLEFTKIEHNDSITDPPQEQIN